MSKALLFKEADLTENLPQAAGLPVPAGRKVSRTVLTLATSTKPKQGAVALKATGEC
jgi:hypothetical protein